MFIKIKSEEIPTLTCIKHAVIADGNVKSLEVETADGILLFSFEYYGSGMTVSKPKPDIFEKRWVISGNVSGVAIVELRVKTKEHAESIQRALGKGIVIEEKEVNITKEPDKEINEGFGDIPF